MAARVVIGSGKFLDVDSAQAKPRSSADAAVLSEPEEHRDTVGDGWIVTSVSD